MPIVAAVVGAFAALFLYSVDVWLMVMALGGAAGWAFWRISHIEQRLRQRAQNALTSEATVERAAMATVEQPLPPPTEVEQVVPAQAIPLARKHDETLPAERPHTYWPRPAAQPRSDIAETAWRFVRQWFSTGNVPVKVGVLISFLGVGFLLKYASDEGYMSLSVAARFAFVGLGGLAMLAIGWRLRTRMPSYGLSLQGGGIGVLYLTTFAAMHLFGLLSGPMAFAVLVLLTVAAMMLALLQNARVLAVMGSIGGFLAPLLVSSGEGSHIVLFGYYALLNLAILIIAWFRAWRVLNLIGFGFTLIIATVWGVLTYEPRHFASTQPFLIFFALLYLALPVLYALRQPVQLRGVVDGTLVFGTPALIFPLQAALVYGIQYGLAISAGVLAAIYLGVAALLLRAWRQWGALLGQAYVAIGVTFATLAIPLAMSGRVTACVWALEGAGLVWLGIRQQQRLARWAGACLVLLAGIAYRWGAGVDSPWPLLNGDFIGAVLIALAALFAAFLLDRNSEQLNRWDQRKAWLLWGWGLLWWLGAGVGEIEAYLERDYHLVGILVFLAFTAALSLAIRLRFTWKKAALPALALLPIAGVMLLIQMIETLPVAQPFANAVWLGWLSIFIVVLFTLRYQDVAFPALAPWGHAGLAWWATVLLAWQAYCLVGVLLQGTIWLPAAALVFVIAWAFLLPVLIKVLPWPFAKFSTAYYGYFLAPLLGIGLIAVMLLHLTSPAAPTPLPYVPLFNPLDILTVLLIWGCWRNLGPIVAAGAVRSEQRSTVVAAMAGVAFVAITASLARTLHHVWDVPFQVEALMASTLMQASLSILWTSIALSLMVLATRRSQRNLYKVGGALMGVVLLKLFLFDLGGTGTLARIISFLGVGVMLLIVGYFAPVPPATKTEDEAAAN